MTAIGRRGFPRKEVTVLKLSVAARLKVSFGTLIGLLALVALGAILSIRSLGTNLKDVADHDMQILQRAGMLQVAVLQIGNGIRDVVGQEDLKIQKESLKLIEENRKVAETAQADLAALIPVTDTDERAVLQNIGKDFPIYLQEVRKGADLVDSAEYDAAKRQILEGIRPVQGRLDLAISAFFKRKTDAANETASRTSAQVVTVQTLLTFLTLVGIGAGLAMAWFISRSIVAPLRSALAFARRVAEGDLSGSIRAESRDEVGTLMTALEEMRQRLAELIGQIHHEGNRAAHLARGLSGRTHSAEEHAGIQNERIMAVSAAIEEMSVWSAQSPIVRPA